MPINLNWLKARFLLFIFSTCLSFSKIWGRNNNVKWHLRAWQLANKDILQQNLFSSHSNSVTQNINLLDRRRDCTAREDPRAENHNCGDVRRRVRLKKLALDSRAIYSRNAYGEWLINVWIIDSMTSWVSSTRRKRENAGTDLRGCERDEEPGLDTFSTLSKYLSEIKRLACSWLLMTARDVAHLHSTCNVSADERPQILNKVASQSFYLNADREKCECRALSDKLSSVKCDFVNWESFRLSIWYVILIGIFIER